MKQFSHYLLYDEDVVVCYGYTPEYPPSLIINPSLMMNKQRELVRLQLGGIPTPKFVGSGGILRNFHHMGGDDLLGEDGKDFRVEQLEIEKEYRFHIFNFPERGAISVRAGTKVPRAGREEDHHVWIRSWEAGWFVNYGLPPKNKKARSLAKNALLVLGYDFGAVDIAIVGGNPIVLEVNSAPGLEGISLPTYGAAMRQLLEEKGYIE